MQIERIELDSKYQHFWRRFIVPAKRYLVFWAITLIAHHVIYGLDKVMLMFYLGLLLFAFIYCFVKSVKVLYRLEFYEEEKRVKVDIAYYNTLKSMVCKKEELDVRVTQDFFSRRNAYLIQIYLNK